MMRLQKEIIISALSILLIVSCEPIGTGMGVVMKKVINKHGCHCLVEFDNPETSDAMFQWFSCSDRTQLGDTMLLIPKKLTQTTKP
jgi:hypothetical protein